MYALEYSLTQKAFHTAPLEEVLAKNFKDYKDGRLDIGQWIILATGGQEAMSRMAIRLTNDQKFFKHI